MPYSVAAELSLSGSSRCSRHEEEGTGYEDDAGYEESAGHEDGAGYEDDAGYEEVEWRWGMLFGMSPTTEMIPLDGMVVNNTNAFFIQRMLKRNNQEKCLAR